MTELLIFGLAVAAAFVLILKKLSAMNRVLSAFYIDFKFENFQRQKFGDPLTRIALQSAPEHIKFTSPRELKEYIENLGLEGDGLLKELLSIAFNAISWELAYAKLPEKRKETN